MGFVWPSGFCFSARGFGGFCGRMFLAWLSASFPASEGAARILARKNRPQSNARPRGLPRLAPRRLEGDAAVGMPRPNPRRPPPPAENAERRVRKTPTPPAPPPPSSEIAAGFSRGAPEMETAAMLLVFMPQDPRFGIRHRPIITSAMILPQTTAGWRRRPAPCPRFRTNLPVEPDAKPPRVFAKNQRPQHRNHRAIPQTGGQHDQVGTSNLPPQLRQPPQRKHPNNAFNGPPNAASASVGVERDGRNAARAAVARRQVVPTAPDGQRREPDKTRKARRDCRETGCRARRAGMPTVVSYHRRAQEPTADADANFVAEFFIVGFCLMAVFMLASPLISSTTPSPAGSGSRPVPARE